MLNQSCCKRKPPSIAHTHNFTATMGKPLYASLLSTWHVLMSLFLLLDGRLVAAHAPVPTEEQLANAQRNLSVGYVSQIEPSRAAYLGVWTWFRADHAFHLLDCFQRLHSPGRVWSPGDVLSGMLSRLLTASRPFRLHWHHILCDCCLRWH